MYTTRYSIKFGMLNRTADRSTKAKWRCNGWRRPVRSPISWPSELLAPEATGIRVRRGIWPSTPAASPCSRRTIPSSRAGRQSTTVQSRWATGTGRETTPTTWCFPSRRRRKRNCSRWRQQRRAFQRRPRWWWMSKVHNCAQAGSRPGRPTYSTSCLRLTSSSQHSHNTCSSQWQIVLDRDNPCDSNTAGD